MSLKKLVHYCSVAGMVCWIVKCVHTSMRAGPTSLAIAVRSNATVFGMFGFFAVMVWLRPKTFGLWIGILMLANAALLAVVYDGALASPHTNPGLDWSWTPFFRTLSIPLVTGLCCVSLRWLHRDPPRKEHDKTVELARALDDRDKRTNVSQRPTNASSERTPQSQAVLSNHLRLRTASV